MDTNNLFEARYVSTSISRNAQDVYAFAGNPLNLPLWAAGLSSGIRRDGDDWITHSPMGIVRVRFAEKNGFGILDHWVTLPSGEIVYNPMRVFPNSGGAEVVFTLYRRPPMTGEEFDRDTEMVRADLQRLKEIMESEGRVT